MGRKNLGGATKKPKISEKSGKHWSEKQGRAEEPGSPGYSDAPDHLRKLQFVKNNDYNPYLSCFLFNYDILILISSANPFITQMRKLGSREGK